VKQLEVKFKALGNDAIVLTIEVIGKNIFNVWMKCRFNVLQGHFSFKIFIKIYINNASSIKKYYSFYLVT